MQKINLFGLMTLSIILSATLAACSARNSDSVANMTGIKVRFETTLISETIEFYSQVLGLTVLESWDENGDKGVIFGLDSKVNGTAFIEFGYKEAAVISEHTSVQIRVKSLAEIMNKIRGKVKFSDPEVRPWGSTYLYLKDPTGIRVIVYEGNL